MMHLKPCNAHRGPFSLYGGLTRHMTLNEAIKKGVMVEQEGKWVVCCDLRGAAERPEQFDSMVPAMQEQFREGCKFQECRLRMGDKGEGIPFLVQVDKVHPGADRKPQGGHRKRGGKQTRAIRGTLLGQGR